MVGHLTREQILQQHAFTQGLAESQIARLASLAAEATFAADEVILLEGRRSRYFYLVLTGSVGVELRTPTFTLSVQVLGAGDAFGWSALLDQQDTLFQVRARERTTTLRVAGRDLAELCQSDTALGAQFLLRTLRMVAGRVKATEARLAEMCGVRITGR